MAVKEIASPTGREAEMIAAVLDITYATAATVEIGAGEAQVINRLIRVSSGWNIVPQGMMRVVNWPKLAGQVRPLLEERASVVAPFELSIGCKDDERTEWVRLCWDGQELAVEEGVADNGVELDVRRLTAALFGGPHPLAEELQPMRSLLPIPIHFPALDHV